MLIDEFIKLINKRGSKAVLIDDEEELELNYRNDIRLCKSYTSIKRKFLLDEELERDGEELELNYIDLFKIDNDYILYFSISFYDPNTKKTIRVENYRTIKFTNKIMELIKGYLK